MGCLVDVSAVHMPGGQLDPAATLIVLCDTDPGKEKVEGCGESAILSGSDARLNTMKKNATPVEAGRVRGSR
jgi:hypothetical protein